MIALKFPKDAPGQLSEKEIFIIPEGENVAVEMSLMQPLSNAEKKYLEIYIDKMWGAQNVTFEYKRVN